jgi:enoyl-[acyl-carrier protein] reductase II
MPHDKGPLKSAPSFEMARTAMRSFLSNRALWRNLDPRERLRPLGSFWPGFNEETPSHALRLLMKRGCDFLGTDLAILGGAMSWVSERHLVAAISNAGGFGVLAGGSMPEEALRAEIRGTRELTQKPFGVNLITMHPMLEKLVSVCIEEKVSHVVLAGGIPTAATIKRVKDSGAKVIAFTPAVALGKRLVKMGVDALVIEGMEAGGHVGPVSTSVLAQEILPAIREVPVFVAGGIGRGEAILTYLEMGAAGVQLGTRFVCSTECIAHQNFKDMFIHAAARDAVTSIQVDPRFPVIPVRALANAATKAFQQKQHDVIKRFENGEVSREDAQLEIEHFWAGALRRAVIDGDVENGSVMAGQSVGMVKKIQPTAEILTELMTEADAALKARG